MGRYQFMERKITSFLHKWKRDIIRKPLLIYGPKQIGKTYTVLEFGYQEYKNVVYLNTDNNKELLEILKKEKSLDRIAMKLSLLSGETIFKTDTLIILDNVNDVNIVKAIKLFGSEKNDYHIIMITSRRENLSLFKGEELQYKGMYGMDFEEYLWAMDQKQLVEFIKTSFKNGKSMPFHTVAMDYFVSYLQTGGFPEVVESQVTNKRPYYYEMIKQKILDTYQKEMSQNKILIDIPRSIEVLQSIPYQLQKDNKKFQYGLMGFGKRAKEYDGAIEFLHNNQLVYRSYKITTVKSPLSSCKEKDSFKLYLNDDGLLFYMMHSNQKQLFTDDKIKMTLYENHIAKSLVEAGYSIYYYQSEGKAEVSFVIQNRMGQVIPIELVNKNLSKSKSLSLFMKKFTVKEAIRITEDNFALKKGIRYIPIYAMFCMKES